MINVPGFQIEDKIYESVRSVIYRAKKKDNDRPVILKTLKETYPDPQEILRYRQEYETLHNLSVSGIPRPIGLERAGNRLVLVTEDIGGQDIKALLKTRTFTLRQLLKIAVETARILGKIHAAGFIHCDIKPSNIVFNPQAQQLQIIDFGSSRAQSDAVSVSENRVLAGTLSYMSPEQTGRMNRPIDWRTDFYSLGAALYELFTGQLPFDTAADALELVHAHVARQPRPPSELDSEVPGGISDIVMKLLAKNPEDRYQSARGIEADLTECLRRLEKTGRITPFSLARQDVSDKFQISRKLVGRQNEIDTLAAIYDRVSRGEKEMMLIAGPAGVGKTALALEAGKGFARHRALFLQGQFNAASLNVPYGPIVSAFRDLVLQLLTESKERLIMWRERIQAAIGNNGQVLLNLIPDAAAIVGDQPPLKELEPAAAQRRIKLVLTNFIRVFCRPEHPLVLFLDFLNLADTASLDLIQSLMTDDGIDFLLLICAYRDEETEIDHPLHKFRQTLEEQGITVGTINLTNLDAAQVVLILSDSL
ncbi:MAG: AAA family ATPase, partial [Desulfobacterales bacterium]